MAPTKRFRPPTAAEVDVYIRERGFSFTGAAFCDWYEGIGWKVGKHPMKDWKAAARTWQHRRNEGRPTKTGGIRPVEDYDSAIRERQATAAARS
jgi:hypothetical protein